jgi:hypothetical protein
VRRLAALVFAFALIFFVDPSSSPLVPPCLFRTIFGVSCPGCGSLRALHALAHGELGRAITLNAPFVFVLPVAACLGLINPRRNPGRPAPEA